MANQNVLVLDDELGFREEVGEFLQTEGYHVLTAGRPSEALDILKTKNIHIGVFDIRLPEMDGLALLTDVKKKYPDLEIVMMTGFGDMPSVIKAMRAGAVDFLNKPFKLDEIRTTLERVSKYQLVRRTFNGKGGDVSNDLVQNIAGESHAMKSAFKLVEKVAELDDTTVLFTGESGTGKELMARSMHALSARKSKSFVAVNCSTIPPELFENEIFGHAKGAYTDAKTDQKGMVEAAEEGTLFLDEIGELRVDLQTKLLRVIEDKVVSPIGTHLEKKINVRIIAATNQSLKKLVKEGRFRADLYHRLNMFTVEMPPLRDRVEDIPVLFWFFLKEFSGKYKKPIKKADTAIIDKLKGYSFPGNVRELKNLVERAVILCEGEMLRMNNFTNLEYLLAEDDLGEISISNHLSIPAMEKECILKALRKSKNNKTKASRLLQISRQALDRKIDKYDIDLS